MAKERSRIADYAVYVAVRVVICLIQMLSYPAALQSREVIGLADLSRR